MDQVSIHIHFSFKNITVMIILTQESKLAQSGLSAACIIGATEDAVKDGVEKGSYQLVFFTCTRISHQSEKGDKPSN